MAGRFSVEAVFRAVDKVTRPVTRMQNRVSKFTRVASNGFRRLNRSVNKFSGSMKRAAQVTAVSSTIVAAGLFNILGAGADFEQAITNVGAVSMKTRAEIAPLEQMALNLGRTTKFTATEAAGAMEILAKAGFSVQQILKATPATLSAAAASGLEIAEVADHVSNVLKGMGLEMSEAARVADVLALASSKTNSTIGSLGESMRNVSATARQLNIPLEEVVAAVALLQDVGLDASVAGSAMNTMLTKMAAPTTGMQKKMRRLGISFKDAKGDMLPLSDVLGQLNTASDKVGGNFDKVAFLAELVGLRGQKAAANLADLFKEGKFEELIKALREAEGAADKMAGIRMDTVKGSVLLLGSAIDAVKVKISDMSSGPLKDLIDNTTKWVQANEALIATNIGGFILKTVNGFETIVKWMKRIGIALAVFVAFNTILKTLVATLTLVNLVMAANPLVLIVLAVLAAVAAFAALVIWIDEVSAGFDKMPAILRVLLSPLDLVVKAIKFIKDNVGVIGSAASSLGSFVGGGLESVGRFFGGDNITPPSIVSPQERTARSIEESKTTSSAEVTIRDQTGRAEVTRGTLGRGLMMEPSGAF